METQHEYLARLRHERLTSAADYSAEWLKAYWIDRNLSLTFGEDMVIGTRNLVSDARENGVILSHR